MRHSHSHRQPHEIIARVDGNSVTQLAATAVENVFDLRVSVAANVLRQAVENHSHWRGRFRRHAAVGIRFVSDSAEAPVTLTAFDISTTKYNNPFNEGLMRCFIYSRDGPY
jgi:hypothetical protein